MKYADVVELVDSLDLGAVTTVMFSGGIVMKKSTDTRRAFVCLLIPLLYTVVFFVFGALASVTEFPTNRSGIYLVFAVIATVLLMLFPLVSLICSIVSIVYQVKALRNQESKAKNAVMMAVSFIYIVATIIFSYLFWQGAMSV